ncbi:MAG: hypothetical protein NTZ18_01505 [Candidatus Komeilibacteria bacterium]|nr:hypothetical protein [Candidatus Komeilibacteria bacterium]
MKRFFDNLYKASRIIIILAPFVILGWLIKQDLALTGRLEFTYDFSHDSPVITDLFPAGRCSQIFQVKDKQEFFQQIFNEPVYFEVRMPQKFDTATVEITYQNIKQPLIQLGLATLGSQDWSYDFKPLENQSLDSLNWFKIADSQGTIWQRQKKYLNREQFNSEADNFENKIVYNFNSKDSEIPSTIDYLVSDYRSPQEVNGWKTATVKFNLANARLNNRKVRFAISSPGLNNGNYNIPLLNIKVVFAKQPLTFKEIILKGFNYFKARF